LEDFQVENFFFRCRFNSEKRQKFGYEKCPHIVTHIAKKTLNRGSLKCLDFKWGSWWKGLKSSLSKCYLVAELQPFEKSLFSLTAC
jgi:hypothetical protein